MAFEAALRKADQLGGSTRAYDQGRLNLCTGFAARWIKYQLLGKADAFWSKPPGSGKPPVFTVAGGRYQETAAGRAKIERTYNQKAEQLERDGLVKAGLATQKYLEGALGKHLTGVRDDPDNPFTHNPDREDVQVLGKVVRCLAPQRALHISLQPGILDGAFHSTAAYRDEHDRIAYFDPCMGEVRLPDTDFDEWWSTYVGLWPQDRTYREFKYCVAKTFNSTADLAQRARDVRQRLAAASSAAPAMPPSPGSPRGRPAAAPPAVQLDSSTDEALLELDAIMAQATAAAADLAADLAKLAANKPH